MQVRVISQVQIKPQLPQQPCMVSVTRQVLDCGYTPSINRQTITGALRDKRVLQMQLLASSLSAWTAFVS